METLMGAVNKMHRSLRRPRKLLIMSLKMGVKVQQQRSNGDSVEIFIALAKVVQAENQWDNYIS
eukprot:scaffold611642_cov417-Attheya_sp.AAC.1